jgi:predicted glycosyltransferase
MKVLFDISHPAHINFFKNTIALLRNNGHDVIITYLQRGKLEKVLFKEFPEPRKIRAGVHRGTKFSIIFEANILKFFKLFAIIFRVKPDIVVSVGSFTGGMVCKILGIPNVQFDDDPERTINVFLEKLTSDKLFFPPIIQAHGKVKTFNALKEWAYLSPKYFKPNVEALERYKVVPQGYIFIREISIGSLNYADQSNNMIASIAKQLPRELPVLLSLEDKSKRELYPEEWTILQEPIDDIHSLMYFSRLLLSSGDSMAREGGMLGIPSIYCGTREMKANSVLVDKEILFIEKVENVPSLVQGILSNKIHINAQDYIRDRLIEEWDDVTEFIISNIM